MISIIGRDSSRREQWLVVIDKYEVWLNEWQLVSLGLRPIHDLPDGRFLSSKIGANDD